MTETIVTAMLAKSGLSHVAFSGMLAYIAATGGMYGNFCVLDVTKDGWRGATHCRVEGVRGEGGKRGGERTAEDTFVTAVLDGDTFTLGDGKNGASKEGETVRLADIQAPELDQCYGVEAKDALEKLTRGKIVELYKDLQSTDDFGRIVRYARVYRSGAYEDNILINLWMLENGYAVQAHSENIELKKRFTQAQVDARARGKGLWGECTDAERAKMGASVVGGEQPTKKGCVIKGNIQDVGKKKVYYLPHCRNYNTATISAGNGEGYFCSEKDAKAAGFVKAEGCVGLEKK